MNCHLAGIAHYLPKRVVTNADLAVQNPYYNPRPITREGIRALLQDAFEGRRPD